MNKLIGMTDYVLEQDTQQTSVSRLSKIIGYAEFLKTPLKLGMIVPCDENGNVLEEPEHYDDWYKWGDFSKYGNSITKKCSAYHKDLKEAKERILFKGLDLCEDGFIRLSDGYILSSINLFKDETIEDLVCYSIELSNHALKQIGV